jgi:outer membrane protein assembly factor BamE (lipoprotein component of BamABCDE complex)
MGGATLMEGKNIIDPYVDTQFGEGYSPEKFQLIKMGMTMEQVTCIVGKPLGSEEAYGDSTKTEYYYTGDGKLLHQSQQAGKEGYDDFAWYRSSVIVDSNNIVVGIDMGWSYD